MTNKIERVRTWNRFRKLLIEIYPEEVFYAQGKAPLSHPPIELRLIFTGKGIQYVFVDTAKGDTLRRTRIPIHIDKYGNFSLEEEDVKRFITLQIGRDDINIRSFELMGGY